MEPEPEKKPPKKVIPLVKNVYHDEFAKNSPQKQNMFFGNSKLGVSDTVKSPAKFATPVLKQSLSSNSAGKFATPALKQSLSSNSPPKFGSPVLKHSLSGQPPSLSRNGSYMSQKSYRRDALMGNLGLTLSRGASQNESIFSKDDIRLILNNQKELRKLSKMGFAVVDTDRSGLISADELEELLNDISQKVGVPAPTKKDVKNILKSIDADGDGEITLDEFTILMKEMLQMIMEMKK